MNPLCVPLALCMCVGIFFFCSAGVELRASYVLGRCSTSDL